MSPTVLRIAQNVPALLPSHHAIRLEDKVRQQMSYIQSEKPVPRCCMISCNPFFWDRSVHLGEGRLHDFLHASDRFQRVPVMAPSEVSRGGRSVDPERLCCKIDALLGQVGIDCLPLLL